jgi:hypothetical protein
MAFIDISKGSVPLGIKGGVDFFCHVLRRLSDAVSITLGGRMTLAPAS